MKIPTPTSFNENGMDKMKLSGGNTYISCGEAVEYTCIAKASMLPLLLIVVCDRIGKLFIGHSSRKCIAS